jgi:hypothetical protein
MSFRALDAFSILQNWPAAWGTSGTLVVCLDKSIVSNGTEYPATDKMGASLKSLGFHWESEITITDGQANAASIANLPTTDNSTPANVAHYHVYIYSKGVMRKKLNDRPFHLHESVNGSNEVFTWAQWVVANQFRQGSSQLPMIGDRITMQAMIDAVVLAYSSDLTAGRMFLDVPPISASHPEALGSNSPIVRDAKNYSSFGVAVSALALEGGGTLHITESQTVSTSGTVPASVHLEFKKGGMLDIATGQTVTILGPITAPPMQIFDGAGSVSFAGNKYLKEVYVNWWFLNNNGASNDASNLQKVASAMTSGMWLFFPLGTNLYINGTVTFAHLANFRMGGINPVDQLTTGAAQITLGPSGALVWDCVRGSTFENLYVVNDGSNNGLLMTQLTSGGGGDLSSRNTIRGNFFYTSAHNASWIGLNISNASSSNNEQHIIEGNIFKGDNSSTYGSYVGTGIRLGHTQVKGLILEKNLYAQLNVSVSANGGSFRALNSIHSNVGTLYAGAFSDAIFIEGEDVEDYTSIIDAQGVGVIPVVITGGRYGNARGGQTVTANTTTYPVFRVQSSLALSIVNNEFETYGNDHSFSSTFALDVVGGQYPLIWSNNIVSLTSLSAIAPGFNTFKVVFGSDTNGIWMAGNGLGGIVGGTASYDGIQSTGNKRPLLRLVGDNVQLGVGEIQLPGIASPTDLTYAFAGAAGATQHVLSVVAKDANGSRTTASNEINITTANATLTGVNYITLNWTQPPSASGYDIIERDLGSGNYRLVASVGVVGTYNIVTNPVGALTYVYPTYNETGGLYIRGPRIQLVEVTFTDGATTPSIAKTDNFKTANTGATVITNFTQGYDGQTINIIVADANTTIQNNASIKNRSGANIVAGINTTYSYRRSGSVWYQVN